MAAADLPSRLRKLPGHIHLMPGDHCGLDKPADLAGIG